jgi:tetratricopeptide (TPR) repeat protein
MTFWKDGWQKGTKTLGYGLATAIALSGVSLVSAVPAARAQVLFEEQGTLSPMQDEYPFEGTAGQAVLISMSSDVFDTVVVLVGPDGQELAFNDDYARSLNSTIVITLPTTGTYTVLARAFSGQGGAYSLAVNPATPYDLAYFRAYESIRNGQVEDAIAAFSEAITIDPTRPMTYLERGDAYYALSNIDAVVADYTRAAELYEQAGDTEMAQSLREQLVYIQETPPPSF